MADLTIAVTNYFNDTVTMLPVQANLKPIQKSAMFHNGPLVDFDGKTIARNFDYHIDFRLVGNRFHRDLLPTRYFHYPRLKRMTQYVKLYHFNESNPGNRVPIYIPEFYTATQREGEHVTISNFSLPKAETVVIKEQFGAKGSKQVVVPANMVTTLLKTTQGLTMAEVKEKFPDLIYSDGTDMDSVFFEKPADLFISELVPTVKTEWRLLVGGNNIYGRERVIKQGPYPQANLEADIYPTVAEVKYENIEEMFDASLVDTLYAMVDFINLPIGSIDLFLTEDGDYGIFEYSTQFAFHGADPHFIRQMLLDGLTKVIVEKGEESNVGVSNTQSVKPAPSNEQRPTVAFEVTDTHKKPE